MIKTKTKELEEKISSREVAPMMEIKHSDLLRKIDKINEDFRESKITFSKYWSESKYKVEGQTREYREFEVTKRGCEFLAHKTTGTKGNLFTDRYMDRFEQMKEQINIDPVCELSSSEVLKFLGDSNLLADIVQAIACMAVQQHLKAFEEINKTTSQLINELEKKNIELSNEGARILREFNDNQAVIEMLKGNNLQMRLGDTNGQIQKSS